LAVTLNPYQKALHLSPSAVALSIQSRGEAGHPGKMISRADNQSQKNKAWHQEQGFWTEKTPGANHRKA
jgi:hypothetical protein